MKFSTVVILVVAGLQLASAKIFERCELAEELLLQGFPKYLLTDWVCLIEAHSGRDTSKIMKLEDGTTQWGLFQINDNYWCTKGEIGGLCELACESLLNENITEPSACAQLVYKDNGFGGWQGWGQFCTGQEPDLPDLSVCDL